MSVARRLDVGSRVLAAIGGGYLAAGLVAAAFARVAPLSRADATQAATLLSFAIYVGIVLVVFHARTALRAWGFVAVIAAIAALMLAAVGTPS
jgi:hypothetical protein